MVHSTVSFVRLIDSAVEFFGRLSVPVAVRMKASSDVKWKNHGVNEVAMASTPETVPSVVLHVANEIDVIFICVCVTGTYAVNALVHSTSPLPGTMNLTLSDLPLIDESVVSPVGSHHGE